MNLMSLADFAGKLTELSLAVHEESHRGLERAAQIVEAEAKASVGHLQEEAGPFAPWAPLKDATVEEKVRLGLPPDMNADGSPLERTGELRDSYEHTVAMGAADGVSYVGSDDPVAEYQELGTQHIPPRSVLGGALFRKEEEIRDELGRYVHGALIGKEVHEQRIEVIGS